MWQHLLARRNPHCTAFVAIIVVAMIAIIVVELHSLISAAISLNLSWRLMIHLIHLINCRRSAGNGRASSAPL